MMPVVRKYAKWMLALAIFCAIGATYVRAEHDEQDRKTIAAMTERMKTVCVGRFLIDLPEDARVSMKMTNLDGFDITRDVESADQFARWIAQRESKLRAAPNMLGRDNIELNKEIRGPNSSGRIFVHTRYRSNGIQRGRRVYHETVTIEAHLNRDGATYSFKSEGDAPERVAVVMSMMSQLVRLHDEVPNSHGFCLDGAFIAGSPVKHRHESVTMFASLPRHPDATLAFWTNTGMHQVPGLLQRDIASTDALTRMRSKTLRGGKRSIGGLSGEEVGVKTIETNFTTNFSFAWETRGSDDNVFVPRLLVEFDTGISPRAGGEPVQSSLSEQMVLHLWERVSSSVRLRPAIPGGASEAADPPVVLDSTEPASVSVTAYTATRK